MTLVWPEILNVTVSKNAAARMKSRYKHEIQKIEILMEFEKLALEHARDQRYKTEAEKFQSDKKFAEYWWDHKFQKVEKLEAEMVEKTAEIAGQFQLLSIFNPVTFYRSVNNEISSRGYNTYIRFYKENRAIQKGFLRFYLNKRFYENYAKVEPYLARGENMARAFPGLPRYFWAGLLLCFFYTGCGLCFSFFSFKRGVFP